MFAPPRFVVVDDDKDHLGLIQEAFQKIGTPCLSVHYRADEDMESRHFLGVRCLLLDLHLTMGPVGSDDSADFARIQTILEDKIDPNGGPFVLILWTAYPDKGQDLVSYLDDNIDVEHSHARPLLVSTLPKERFIGSSGSGRPIDELSEAIKEVVETNPQVAALLEWESNAMAAAGDTLVELLKLIPNDERTSVVFPIKVDELLSRLAYEFAGKSHAEKDPRKAIVNALAPILSDRIMNRRVSPEISEYWKRATTKVSQSERIQINSDMVGSINRMMHLEIANSESIKPSEWGSVVQCPFENGAFSEHMGCSVEDILKNEFKIVDGNAINCNPVLVRVGAACDYAQEKGGPIVLLLGFEIPKDINSSGTISSAIWKSPVFKVESVCDGRPFLLKVHSLFPVTVLPRNCSAWRVRYRIREQILMQLIVTASNHISRPGIVCVKDR